jgi:hypothetical protein
MDTTSGGRIAGLVTPATDSFFDPPCAADAPCRLQRIDPVSRVVESETTFVAVDERGFRLRHDAWSGRVLVLAASACEDRYPYDCTRWSVHQLAYE